ncbi:hypothetical protein ON010_g2258 [Phytophthora cinnamomi]|nr:hypothetical protein ON010_g2258 [Phytophthora cinnamomi]
MSRRPPFGFSIPRFASRPAATRTITKHETNAMPGDADCQTLSESLQAAMNAAPRDPVELARLVRELHSDPEQPHSSGEKELLTAAGLAAPGA